MINLLTIDLEDYYQVSAFDSVVKRTEWDKYESRIERNTYRLLEMMSDPRTAHSAERIHPSSRLMRDYGGQVAQRAQRRNWCLVP